MTRAGSFIVSLVAIVLIALAAGSAVAAQNSIAGTWIGQTQVPDRGADDITLRITKTKTGYTGTIADSVGMVSGAVELKNITFANNEVSFSFPLGDGAVVAMKLKFDGDTLKGKWEHESGDTGEMSFERKKQ